MNKAERIGDTWLGIGRLGDIHFVFNSYGMSIHQNFMRIVAIYDGINNEFIVASDLYNISFVPSMRTSLVRLFSVFSFKESIPLREVAFPNYENLYTLLRSYIKSTELISPCHEDIPIKYVHSSNLQKYLVKNCFGFIKKYDEERN